MKKAAIGRVAENGLLILIRVYQHTVSILLGPCCRFTPSCSSYAFSAVQRFGVKKGSWLATKRVVKCHPFHPGGYDPIPEIPKNS